MSSAREHHAKAEQLLEQAHTAQDQISRSQLLAEAQVHATLALSVAPGTSPPGQGQPEPRGTTRDVNLAPSTLKPHETGRTRPARPARPPGDTTAQTPAKPGESSRPPMRPPLRPPRQSVVDAPPVQRQPLSYQEPSRPRQRRAEEPGDEEPGDPGEQEPGGPGEPPPGGGFTPTGMM